MSILEQYYNSSPVGVIDQNKWTLQTPEVQLLFRNNALYTPLMTWDATPQQTGAANTTEFELLEGDVDANPIPLTANFVDAAGIDSRARDFSVLRYGDKVQYHKSDAYFNMWKMSGGRDWQPLLRGLLGDNLIKKVERLSRNVWFKGSKTYWTYSGAATDFATIGTNDRFNLAKVNEWRFRVGQTGSPVVPGLPAGAKLAIIPPGATFDIFNTLAVQTSNEAAMWRDAAVLGAGERLNYELATYKGVTFLEAPSDRFGINPNVLYNAGAITKQYAVTQPIKMGDGAPDPATTKVDGVWKVGQSATTHFIQLEDFSAGDYNVNDYVTIHIVTTNAYGVTGGVDPFDGRTIVRRVVAADATANTLAFDKPILTNYTSPFVGKSVTGNTDGTFYAYVTRGRNIGFALVLGSRDGVKCKVLEPIKFYEPRPIDDFDSVWRFSYDGIMGFNIAEPNLFELYFFNTSIPKPGGVI